MSISKFDILVEEMITKSSTHEYNTTNRIGKLLKIMFCTLLDMKNKKATRFISKIAKKNIRRRTKLIRSRF